MGLGEGAEGSSRKCPQRPEASKGHGTGSRRGNHDDAHDDAIVLQNSTYTFKLHPEGRICPMGLYAHNRTRNRERRKAKRIKKFFTVRGVVGVECGGPCVGKQGLPAYCLVPSSHHHRHLLDRS